LFLLAAFVTRSWAHPDLLLQIDALTHKLERQPDNVSLLLKRGELQRRHANWAAARADFQRVRNIQPHNQTVDWFEGRLDVESGEAARGRLLLDRFLHGNPDHTIALQNRAQANLLLKQPLLAAKDYQRVIDLSEHPSPALYTEWALALVAAGDGYLSAAMASVRQGLQHFPQEVALTGLGTDVSLAVGDTGSAQGLLNRLPQALLDLRQWQNRQALLDCELGSKNEARRRFDDIGNKHLEPVPGYLSGVWLAKLIAEPLPDNCRAAARAMLNERTWCNKVEKPTVCGG
jgi:predicted Zn-dependent protease